MNIPRADTPASDANRILLVEDHEHIRKLVRASIKPLAIEIDEAIDSTEALQLLERDGTKYAIVILDVMLPGPVTGFDLCRRFKTISETSPCRRPYVIMLTARAQESDRRTAYENGADLFMTKPFSPLELLKVIRSLLEA